MNIFQPTQAAIEYPGIPSVLWIRASESYLQTPSSIFLMLHVNLSTKSVFNVRVHSGLGESFEAGLAALVILSGAVHIVQDINALQLIPS